MKTAYGLFGQVCKDIRDSGLWKEERILTTPQAAHIDTTTRKNVLNFCANNYLGFSNHPALIEAARESYALHGHGLSSVRFICGTQDVHKELESKLSAFLGMEDTILYSSCFDANTGLFETLLGEEDAIISDALNHASIIDGIRLCKAKRYRYANNDMAELEKRLEESRDARIRLIATDGVFSMDGTLANLSRICDLADRHDALVLVDDSHAVGLVGRHGKGTPEHCGVSGRIDILTGTLGKALGGASGGYTSAGREIVDLLRQRSRPYLFSNTLAPAIAASACKALDLISSDTSYRDRLDENTQYFRTQMLAAGFLIPDGVHPIVPIMLGDAGVAQEMAERMLEKGVYVVGFFFPVVPQGKARIRTQISAAHTREELDFAIRAFSACRDEMGLEKT